MFESFCELPKRAIERRWDTDLFTQIGDCAVHKIHFGLAFCKNVLKHARIVFAGSVSAFLHQRSRIAVKLDSHCLCDRLSFGNKSTKKCAGRRKACGCAVMQ